MYFKIYKQAAFNRASQALLKGSEIFTQAMNEKFHPDSVVYFFIKNSKNHHFCIALDQNESKLSRLS